MTFSFRPVPDDPRLAGLVERLRGYLDGELAAYERDNGFTHDSRLTRADLEPVWKRSRELGFYGIHLPEEYGGQNLTRTQLAVLKEEVGASGRVLGHSVLGDMGGPLRAGDILRHATDHQRDTYLLPLVRGERACCFSLTETDAGSDVRAMRTTAVRDGDSYRLTGHKVFSSAGPFADFAIVVARMAGTEDTYSAFFVDLDSPGCRVTEGATPMSGEHIESDIVLEDCRVPAANLLGEEGRGLRIALGRVTVNRLLHCPSALGAARRALELSRDRALTRTVDGRPLIALQAIQHKLADMAADLYAARSMTYAALAALDRGEDVRTEAFLCKLFVAEAAFRILDQAVQIHGKEGLTQGNEVEYLFRKMRMFRILTGTSEIQRNGIARRLATLT
ncbi:MULTISPECIES: acyl-CoA dehydrogenase family protein [Streptomyces]|uniref:Alkylation response protein AidB-like acyl-CoA dehydrogenase n=2 Tax=Streptomyces TaxID=1883 RepID=A0ABT9L7W0_STRGD|nr:MULTISPECIES: acyl-CoA dehydrogenase family protein [Streptomyces]MDP9679799.1 alkylation response protein AidB-like acyl-CoA dehydrogenase [Streptomyces griseoviridis]GGT25063.1 acyl-CoA dehydrogenase [Streptomyces griseoviridis]GGU58985.1 acyl-CoA dehydrogenase [Streptomyces daghestanicus]GHI30074.1 acyl-CoA dehydrogenase [Streptomyces daghestanicus]